MVEPHILQIRTPTGLTSKKSKRDWENCNEIIPCGTQTLSKMPSKFIEGIYPIFIERGLGCHIWDNEGNGYIDYPNALGAILLGYNYPSVNKAIIEQLEYGSLFTLPSQLEYQLAKKLTEIIPCAEMVRFLKTGSEATSAAIKIARSFTGKEHVAFCGYHGWHDWFTVNTPKNKGIPKCYGELTHKFAYNDPQSLVDITTKYDLAAIILEPCIFDIPKHSFLEDVRKIADKAGALLIFDEVVTGFRFKGHSAQKFFKVTPDLATFGKAMANGLPISVVCGKKEFMKELEGDCFVSSTFGGELLSISAALATIQTLQNEDVYGKFEFLGGYLKDGYNEIAKFLDIETSCLGYANRTMHLFPTPEHKSLFWQECISRGVFFGYAQFINYSHEQIDIDYTLEVVKDALKVVKDNWSEPLKALKGKPAQEVFRLVAQSNKSDR